MVELLDLVDIDVLEGLQDCFKDLLGFHVSFADIKCVAIGGRKANGVCKLLLEKKEGKHQCYLSDLEAGELAVELKAPVLLYRCHCFFGNFVIPIKVTNEVVGFLFGGQFFVRRPGYRSPSEWDTIIKSKGISEEEQETFKNAIKIKEEAEWNNLKDEVIHAVGIGQDGKLIKSGFFLKKENEEGRPTAEDLQKVAQACGLINPDTFIEKYMSQSDPTSSSHRIYTQKDIFYAIKLLSAIAHAFSEECNTKYALKTYYETTQEIKKIPNIEKKLGSDYRNLSHLIEKLLEDLKSVTPQVERVNLIDTIDKTSSSILTKILEHEEKQMRRDIWKNKYLYFTVISKAKQKEEDSLQRIIEKRKNLEIEAQDATKEVSRSPFRTQKEKTMKKLKELREDRDALARERSMQGPASFIFFIVTIVLSLALVVIPSFFKGS